MDNADVTGLKCFSRLSVNQSTAHFALLLSFLYYFSGPGGAVGRCACVPTVTFKPNDL